MAKTKNTRNKCCASKVILMQFEVLGFGADGQERTLETSLVQKGGFIKAQG